jgi:hypothetical protein
MLQPNAAPRVGMVQPSSVNLAAPLEPFDQCLTEGSKKI